MDGRIPIEGDRGTTCLASSPGAWNTHRGTRTCASGDVFSVSPGHSGRATLCPPHLSTDALLRNQSGPELCHTEDTEWSSVVLRCSESVGGQCAHLRGLREPGLDLRVQGKLSFTGCAFSALPSVTSPNRKSPRRDILGFNSSSSTNCNSPHPGPRRSRSPVPSQAMSLTTAETPKLIPWGQTHHPLSSSTIQGFPRHMSNMHCLDRDTRRRTTIHRVVGNRCHRMG